MITALDDKEKLFTIFALFNPQLKLMIKVYFFYPQLKKDERKSFNLKKKKIRSSRLLLH